MSMIMKLHISPKLVLLSLLISQSVFADVPDNQIKEVNHLLAYVKNSGCIINRNGSDHLAEEGVSHIENKYDYFRDDISSTEDFIEYSATKSTMSGNFYTVTCPGKKTIKTQDWLLTELKKYRSK
jgi:Family of unknown function (DUF5329)